MGRPDPFQRDQNYRRRLAARPYATRLRPLPVPLTDICEPPLRCLRVNSEWASHLIGAIQSLLERDAWQGSEPDVDSAIQVVERVCDMLSIDCPRDEENLVTQITWECGIGNLNGSYDGTPGSIEPDAPADNFDADATDTPAEALCRPNSLCAVLSVMVNTLLDAELQKRGGLSTLLSLSAYILGTVGALGWVAGPGLIAVTFSGILFGALGAALTGLSSLILGDTNARSEVVCCLLQNLSGKAINEANFAAACVDCGCFQNPNSITIMNAICPAFQDQNVYLHFVQLLGNAQQGCADGLLDPCLCGEWCAFFDFTASDGGWSEAEVQGATYSAGIGWVHRDATLIGQANERRINILKTHASRTITSVQIVYDYTFGHYEPAMGSSANGFFLKVGGVSVEVLDMGEVREGVERVFTWYGCQVSSGVQVKYVSSHDFVVPETFSGNIRIKSIKVQGWGTAPFGDPCP